MKQLPGEYPTGVRVAAKEMKSINARLRRWITLPSYDFTIEPRAAKRQVQSFLPDAKRRERTN